MIRIAHMYSSMRKGGGAELSILSLIRGMDTSRFENFLILNDRKTPEHDLTGVNVLPPRCAPGEQPWWREWRFARDVAREIRRRKIDILHSHAGSMPHDRLALLAAGWAGAKVVRTLRGIHPNLHKGSGRAAKFFDRYTAAWTVISPYLASALTEHYGVADEKIAVIPNGIDLTHFARPTADRANMRRELGIADDELLFLSIGRLAKVKDYPTILKAFAQARPAVNRPRLLIVGEGDERSLIETQIAETGLEDVVTLLGYREDIPNLLSAADVFVMASLREGFGRAAAEAMAAGLPVIGTEVAGLRYVLDEGKAGMLVPLQAPDRMAQAMIEIARDADLRRSIAATGRDRAFTTFSTENMVSLYQQLYETVAGNTKHFSARTPA